MSLPSGRKAKMIYLGMFLLTGGMIACQFGSAMAGMYPAFVGGICGLVGLFIGGHAATDIASLKNGASE